MNKAKSTLFTATLSLAIAFTFGCGGGDDNGDGTSSPSDSSSDSQQSGSGSCDKYAPAAPTCNEGETITIGTQTWQKCNLNVVPSTGRHSCYCNTPGICNNYGRLYDWATAMALPANCNSTSCSSQINTKHRGICPIGWHIPSEAEWKTLRAYIESDKGCSDCDAEHLMTVKGIGWYLFGGGDSYGFSALGGGYGSPDGSFSLIGEIGRWWSANEFGYSSGHAYSSQMSFFGDGVDWEIYGKSFLFSVRCIQD